MPPLPAAEPLTLAHRLVRLIALASVVYAVSVLIGELYSVVTIQTFSWLRGGVYAWTRSLERSNTAVFYLLMTANHILLAVSGIGLWRYRGWARNCLIIWAVVDIILNVCTRIISFFAVRTYYLQSMPNQPMPPLMSYFLTIFGNVAAYTIPAVVVLYLMRQREVAALFGRTSTGGFDVVPTAQRAE
jgi:hypothetical protein